MPERFHPSEFIQDELDARGWPRLYLAQMMGGDAEEIGTNLLALDLYFEVGPTNDGCRLGTSMCHDIGRAFGISGQFFINLENAYINWESKDTTNG